MSQNCAPKMNKGSVKGLVHHYLSVGLRGLLHGYEIKSVNGKRFSQHNYPIDFKIIEYITNG